MGERETSIKACWDTSVTVHRVVTSKHETREKLMLVVSQYIRAYTIPCIFVMTYCIDGCMYTIGKSLPCEWFTLGSIELPMEKWKAMKI